MFLTEFDFEVQHCPGKMNDLPDALSRFPTLEEKAEEEEGERMSPPPQIERNPEEQIRLFQLQITRHQITLSQQEDPDIRRLLREQPQRFELWDDILWARIGLPNILWKIWVLQQLRTNR
ncbi:hypothetical protein PR048_009100 [Dryococelus australis]|uniref:Uncharacterized protein n=1 Tax=Dryococelus australis TaxID=614101 RepID=A0ABQ9I008_9NEOP|nr:hypothetical protein PR048_009100 [Dryococelus australis]